MEKIRCCVIDDEPLAAQLISGYIDRTPFLENAGSFDSAQAAIKHVLEGKIDLIFLDINMPQLNGLEFARIIPPTTRVVFTTAYDNYAVEGFKVNAVDYLLKPVSYDEFKSAAIRALRETQTHKSDEPVPLRDFIIVKSEYKLVQIAVSDIIYVEGLKDYVKICTKDNSIMTLMNIKNLEQSLPPEMFMRVHRSFIVNKTKIKVIERNRIVFGNVYIPISETYKQAFSEYINSHLVGTALR